MNYKLHFFFHISLKARLKYVLYIVPRYTPLVLDALYLIIIMEINLGGLESISRPPSRESSETTERGQYDMNATDEEKQDPKLQRAIEEMRRLDELLSVRMCREKEAKRQRKQCQAELWNELMVSLPEGHSERSHEAMNARLFWALDSPIGPPERTDFVSLFKTQIGDNDLDRRLQQLLESEERADDLSETSELTCEELDEASHGDASKGKKRQQKNFVRRNIELVRGKCGQVLLTQAEEERLAELLRDIDEEEEESARGADNEENMWAVPVSTSQGYTPETSDMERLIAIDSKLRLFQPVVELPSHTFLNEDCASDTGPRRDGDPQPGEKVLQEIKERRMQEMQLLEIQRQLDLLGQDQEMTGGLPCGCRGGRQ
ncbi:fibrous sheath-interacting protein 1 isoform X2 [Syngnathoides biaculeatus]|uniref:fibrous sheath-interacting protein 1 isoform X2 n=1 Tax=Syngnathoides biaculeatus TaxID=300417 RepID=UPI002ADE8FD2|nr:fibrous sheath-interacting protein 1 isoform X2 [Syngnathoides biaculeatus]